MAQQVIATNSYPKLLSQLKKVFVEGLQRIEEEKVKTYWRTGELIAKYILANKDRAEYGGDLFAKLSADLGIEVSTLQRSARFYRAYPILAALPKLSWLHQLQLITIEDTEKRELFAQRAAKKGWGYRELSEAIRLDRLTIEEPEEKPSQSPAKLSVIRSRLFTYKVLEPGYIHPIDEYLVIDLGFHFLIHTEIKGVRLRAEEIIESVKAGGVYSFKHSDAAPKELYTYKALVERVIDGDTFWLNVDLGFSSWVREKIRLRGIDCPELSTKEGQDAKKFVEARLKEAEFIVIKTHKDDKYGRYLADVFYSPKEDDLTAVLEQGVFLNQELLGQGLAKVFE